jgi:hypothetical protein
MKTTIDRIDGVIAEFGDRHLVTGSEVVDALLDLRNDLRAEYYSDDTKEGWLRFREDFGDDVADSYSEALEMQGMALGPEPARPEQ